jgi:hypothetical protein
VGDSVICLIRVVGSSGRLPSRGSRASSGEDFFASRPVVVATTMVIGAPRAPVFGDGIHAVAKHGQMTGGPGDALDQELLLGTGMISGGFRAYDAYAPERSLTRGAPLKTPDRCPRPLPVITLGAGRQPNGPDFDAFRESGRRVSNPRPSAWEANALRQDLPAQRWFANSDGTSTSSDCGRACG